MKTARVPIIQALTLAAVCAAPAAAQQRVAAGHALSATGFVRLWTGAGTLRIEAWDRDSVAVTGTVPAGRRFGIGGNRAGVKAAIDHMEDDDVSHLEVRVPRRAQVWVKTAAGSVTVSGLAGTLDVYTVTGNVTVSGALQAATLESMGGDVAVTGSVAVLRAGTASGNLRLAASGEDVTATTVSGTVRLDAPRVQRGRFETVDGPVRWDGPIMPGSVLEVTTHSGDVDFSLPGETAGEFTLTTFRGKILNELDGIARSSGGDRRAEFIVAADNGTRVTVRSFRGLVTVRKK